MRGRDTRQRDAQLGAILAAVVAAAASAEQVPTTEGEDEGDE